MTKEPHTPREVAGDRCEQCLYGGAPSGVLDLLPDLYRRREGRSSTLQGSQAPAAESIGRSYARQCWQMWSRKAARRERPQALSPLVMATTATSKAAAFSCTVPKSGMLFMASTPLAHAGPFHCPWSLRKFHTTWPLSPLPRQRTRPWHRQRGHSKGSQASADNDCGMKPEVLSS